MLKERWCKTYYSHRTIYPSIQYLSLSTAEAVLRRFYLRCHRYSGCFEYECKAVERIPALYQGSPVVQTPNNKFRSPASQQNFHHISGILEQAGETSENLLIKVRKVVMSKLQLDANQVISVSCSGQNSPSQSNQLSPTLEIVAKMSSYEHRTSCLKNSAKLKCSNIFLTEDVSPANQTIRNTKMDDLRAARQRGGTAYFSGTNLLTKLKKTTTHSSRENVASLGTADGTAARYDASGRGNTVQIEAYLTGCTEEGSEARVQTDAARTGVASFNNSDKVLTYDTI